MDGRQAGIWTAMPGIVQSFNATERTCVIQPALKMSQQAKDGSKSLVNLPLLLDCPVVFPAGGAVLLTFPIAAGDECLVVFASRCIDAWWQSGGVQRQAEFRMHDLSDGFAIVGVSSKPHVAASISTTKAQLRSTDGATLIELNPAGQIVTLTAPGGVVINGDVTVNGKVTATGDVIGQGTHLHSHTHTGVTTGGGTTGPPT